MRYESRNIFIWRCRDIRIFELSLKFFHLSSQSVDLAMGSVRQGIEVSTGSTAFNIYLIARDRLQPGLCRLVLLHCQPLLEQF